MEQNDIASFQIDKNIVVGVVEKAIKTSVIAQLTAGQDVLVDKMADWIINTRCDENGNTHTGYDAKDRNKYTMVEAIFQQQLKDFAKAAVAEWIETNRADIKAKFYKAMQKSNVAEAFIGAMVKNITDSYSTKVEIKFTKNDPRY